MIPNVKVLFVLYFLLQLQQLTSTFAAAHKEDDKGQPRPERRTIGGHLVRKFEIPYIVAILRNNGNVDEQFCGGSILNNKFIISAAHCFVGVHVPTIRILAGARDLTKRGRRTQLVPVNMVFLHDMYDNPRTANDIAIVELQLPLTFNKAVQPISIPPQGAQSSGVAKLSGWGQTRAKRSGELGGPTSNQLLTVNLTIIPYKECVRLHNEIRREDILHGASQSTVIGVPPPASTNICAGAIPVGGKDACHGDSGGPLQCWRKEGGQDKAYLCGVVSGGYGCGLGLPSWYTEVAQFHSWIVKHINQSQFHN